MTQLKDVLHLYTPFFFIDTEGIEHLVVSVYSNSLMCEDEDGNDYDIDVKDGKPKFRPLSSMTEEDVMGWARTCGREADLTPAAIHVAISFVKKKGIEAFQVNEGDFHLVPLFVCYLLKKGFDLFGLIDSGQAIDATEIIQRPTGEMLTTGNRPQTFS